MGTYRYYGTASLADIIGQLGQYYGTGTAFDYQRSTDQQAYNQQMHYLQNTNGFQFGNQILKKDSFIDSLRQEIKAWHEITI